MLRYARVPSNLPASCDGCGESKKFDMNHALDCKKVGLVTARHDEIRDELRGLLAHVFSPSRIRCEPMINPALMRANGTKTHVLSASSSSDFLNADRGNLLIRDFWRDRLIPLLTFVWRILTANLIRICHQRRLWNDKRKRKKEILQTLWESTSPFHTLRGIDGRNVRLWSPSISQEACKVACRRTGEALLNSKGFH